MITVDYLGVQGSGKTVKAAKADAARKVADFVASARSPLVRVMRGHVLIAWQTGVDACAYTYVSLGAEDGAHYYSCSQGGDIEDAMRAVRNHVASNLGDASLADPRDQTSVARDIEYRNRFAALYREHIEAGKSEIEAHRLACNGIAA